jgi:hypothetical protein
MDGKSFNARFELLDCFDIDDKYFSSDIKVNKSRTEKHFHFDETMFDIDDNSAIDGYFQTDKYFNHCKDLILDILKFKDSIIEKSKSLLPDKENLVSIHIRRGDYTTPNPYHIIIGEDYVDNALLNFKDKDYHFVVFSDDVEWCKSIWGDKDNFTIFESDSHYVDMCAMSLCDHNIIGNSSFSWWASYLSTKNMRKVIAPRKWFGVGYSNYIIDDIYTDDMLIVDIEKSKKIETINILTICTGKYTIFFKDFYESCEKYFLTDYNKKYFVFTDGDILENENIVKIHQDKLGWPYDTMLRFKMFNSIKDKLKGDYTFFFNTNMKFVDEVGVEVIPDIDNDYLIGVKHPGFYNQPKIMFPYERLFESSFYIGYDTGSIYYQGCFNGGRTSEFLEMSSILESKINIDLANGIIPVWHDESALNCYFNSKNPLCLDSGYAYPESVDIPFDKKIIQVDKNKFGGHQSLRN